MKTLVLTFFSIFCFSTLSAQFGTLDNSFGSGGIVTMDINNSNDVMKSIVVQPDGKIIVAGYSSDITSDGFCLIRLNDNGTLDNSFGTNGIVITNFTYTSVASDIALQSDGKIVVAGHTWTGTENAFAIARYQSDGTIDTSFGNAGKIVAEFPGKSAVARALKIQNDGKIIVAGHVYTLNNDYDEFAIARFNSDGSLDLSFDLDGKITTSFGAGTQNWVNSIALQNDGKIVAAGFSDYFFALARYHTNGNLDASFGTSGLVTTSIPNATQGVINDIELAADGSIIAAGLSIDTTSNFTVAKYDSFGVLDTSFGVNGILVFPISTEQDAITDLSVQPDNKLLVAGSAIDNNVPVFALARFDNDGNPDNSFGTSGIVKTMIDPNNNQLNAVALQPDGKIIATGFIGYNPADIAIARYASGILSVNDPSENTYGISIFPNPTSNKVYLNLASGKHGNVSVNLYDINSRLLQQKAFYISKGEGEKLILDIEKYPAGVYFVSIFINDVSRTHRIVKY